VCLIRGHFEGAIMTIGVLALVGVTPEHVAVLTAAGYAVRKAADTVRAMLTNGRGGLSGDEMAWLPTLEIICAVGAGYEAVDLDTARRRGIVVANCPDANAPAVADSAMMLLMAATRHLLQADRFVRAGRRMRRRPWRAWPETSRAPAEARQTGRNRTPTPIATPRTVFT
jgi:lactate dehydrogenase-like 2-hydroxyacid dehydrogenase